MEGATTVAHGCNGKANDELRLELGVRALDPSMTVLAPARMLGHVAREQIEYAKARRIPIPSTIDSPYTVDTNLWGRSIERGVLEDPWQESPEDIYALTRSPQTCPNEPAYVEVEFEQGVPLRANGIEMPLVELIESLETIAGAHGVGRIDMVENATTGGKSREIYEAPGGGACCTPRTASSMKLVIPRDLERLAHDLGRAYADLVYNGRWFSPTREAIDAFMRDDPAARHRRRAAETVQGRLPGRRPPLADGPGAPSGPTAKLRPPTRRLGPLMAHLWSGRFAGDPDAELFAFGSSFRFDRRLFEDDVRGQPAWAAGLARAGVLSAADARGDRRAACDEILESGWTIPASSTDAHGDEDVHAFVERELVARVGDAGRRLHTGRSRNEQVAVDLRLYLKRRFPRSSSAIADADRALRRSSPIAPATR